MINVEFMKVYKLCIETCMGVKPGEKVVIVTDPGNMDRAEALAIASSMADAEPFILCQSSLNKFSVEPPEIISECIKKADVILVALSMMYSAIFFHTKARKEALKRGARFACVWESPENEGLNIEDILQTRKLTEKISTMLTNAEKVRVRTKNGTDITMNVKGRRSLMFSSILNQPGDSGSIPDYAEAAIAPIEGSAEGVVVIDVMMAGLGAVKDPIVWKVKGGRVVEISGRDEAQQLKDLLKNKDANSSNIAELGVGTIVRGKVVGAFDDKKIFGTGHIAIGDNQFGDGNVASDIHLDGVFKKMTLELDGRIVMDDGVLLE